VNPSGSRDHVWKLAPSGRGATPGSRCAKGRSGRMPGAALPHGESAGAATSRAPTPPPLPPRLRPGPVTPCWA
jgi:hypothetical protein